MIKEIGYMTDILNKNGLQEGDSLVIKPFGKKVMNLSLKYAKTILTTKKMNNSNWTYEFESVQGEEFYFELKRIKVPSINQQQNHRYLLSSECGTPFKLNGSFVTQAFIEVGDVCEFGYHQLNFKRNQSPEEQFHLYSKFIDQNKKLIGSDLPILIEGETGVGKTSLAKEIHELSLKRGRFVHINLSAYSSNLIESELFGHVKGAFTGAMNEKKGALRISDGGTLFLDEIDSLPVDIQTKLLLFFDSKEITPVGSELSYKVDTRVICASGQRLQNLVENKKMRKDFYFRVASGSTVAISSLRDAPLMIKRFCNLYAIEKNVVIPQKIIEFYSTLPWPGNYRQLRGHLDKKLILMNGRKMDFDESDNNMVTLSSDLFDINKEQVVTMKDLKLNYAKKIYFECDENLTRASKLLGISPRSLRTFLDESKRLSS